jgi:hypothetical protein
MQSLYIVTIEALPAPGSEHFALYGGAYIDVFTDDSTIEAAIETARHEAEEAGWHIQRVQRAVWVTRTDFDDDAEALECFEQALVDGVVSLVQTYPLGREDDDEVH